jgi:hypothetical protein
MLETVNILTQKYMVKHDSPDPEKKSISPPGY